MHFRGYHVSRPLLDYYNLLPNPHLYPSPVLPFAVHGRNSLQLSFRHIWRKLSIGPLPYGPEKMTGAGRVLVAQSAKSCKAGPKGEKKALLDQAC